MDIKKDISLAKYSTMRLGGNASYLVEVDSKETLEEALNWSKEKKLPILMIGGGSNIIWKDEGFSGLVIVNRISHFEILNQDDNHILVKVGAGENWDKIVKLCSSLGFSGIECLSLIPGSAGATPIQNVGAYGQEVSSVLKSIEAFDTQSWQFVTLEPNECHFSYRHSRFKDEPGRFYIAYIDIVLKSKTLSPPFYASLASYLTEHKITDYSPSSIREAVIAIRRAKLPDPNLISNSGSFFGNPIIPNAQFYKLSDRFGPDIPHWPVDNAQQKISAGWLIEKVGYKDYHDPVTGIGTWPTQSLVLVNESAHSTADLLKFKEDLVFKVKQKFDITLVQEPELLPL